MPNTAILFLVGLLSSFAHGSDTFHLWKSTLRGANVFSENPIADLDAAKNYGIHFVRLGATGDRNDFRYLVGEDGNWNLSKENLNRLRATIRRFGERGLKIILLR